MVERIVLREVRCLSWDEKRCEIRHNVDENDGEDGGVQEDFLREAGRNRLGEEDLNHDEEATGRGACSIMISRAR